MKNIILHISKERKKSQRMNKTFELEQPLFSGSLWLRIAPLPTNKAKTKPLKAGHRLEEYAGRLLIRPRKWKHPCSKYPPGTSVNSKRYPNAKTSD